VVSLNDYIHQLEKSEDKVRLSYAENSKLLVTFSSGISATILVVVLSSAEAMNRTWSILALSSFFLSLCIAIMVLMYDKYYVIPVREIVAEGRLYERPERDIIADLMAHRRVLRRVHRKRTRIIAIVTPVQVSLAVACCSFVVAAVALGGSES